MDNLIQLLASQAGYAPNETDLKVTTLTTLVGDMRTKKTGAINTLTPLSNARISRNTLLYTKGTGLVDIAGEVKKYITISKLIIQHHRHYKHQNIIAGVFFFRRE